MKPIAGLALCLLGGGCGIAPPVEQATSTSTTAEMEKFIGCPTTGLTRKGKPPGSPRKQASNRKKNRFLTPSTFESGITLANMAAPGDDRKRFPANKDIGVRVTGYVAFVIRNFAGEECNCFKQDDAHSDTHIDLVTSPTEAGDFTKHVIVEVTPRMKYLAKQRGEDWSTDGLVKQFYHHTVNVEGWLFWDAEHVKSASHTNPQGKHNWRATCWEVHPVTSMRRADGDGSE